MLKQTNINMINTNLPQRKMAIYLEFLNYNLSESLIHDTEINFREQNEIDKKLSVLVESLSDQEGVINIRTSQHP